MNTMECKEFEAHLDRYVDGQLEYTVAAACREHVATCERCAPRLGWELQLRRGLKNLPVPAASPDFANRVLGRATGRDRLSFTWRDSLPYALAASLALSLGLVLWFDRPAPETGPSAVPATAAGPAAMRTVSLAADRATPVRLAFRSSRDLAGVTIALQLPEGVELEAHPGKSELTWQADLQAGTNLLELPVVLLRGAGGVLTASVSAGASRKEFQVRLGPEAPGARIFFKEVNQHA